MPLRRMFHQVKTERLLTDGRKLFYLVFVFSYCGTVEFTFLTAPVFWMFVYFFHPVNTIFQMNSL